MVGPNRMPTPKWLTPQETIAENVAFVRHIALEGRQAGLEHLYQQLTAAVDAIEESVAEMDKKKKGGD